MSRDQRARRYAIISGKGGVGKTVITANLAAALVSAGDRTLVLDADLGLANLDVILGEHPSATLGDFLAGDRTIDDILIHTRAGFDLLPAGSGTFETTQLTPHLASKLESLLKSLDEQYDAILFDAGAGIGEIVLHFARIADEVVLVVTPEPTSMMDAYATVKVLAVRFGCRNFRLVVNHADPRRPEQSGMAVAAHLQQVVTRFLSSEEDVPVRLHLAGSLPVDPAVGRAVCRRRLIAEVEPEAPAACLIPRLAQSLRGPVPDRAP
jgi:flagellar biosynthesis protein FlhG